MKEGMESSCLGSSSSLDQGASRPYGGSIHSSPVPSWLSHSPRHALICLTPTPPPAIFSSHPPGRYHIHEPRLHGHSPFCLQPRPQVKIGCAVGGGWFRPSNRCPLSRPPARLASRLLFSTLPSSALPSASTPTMLSSLAVHRWNDTRRRRFGPIHSIFACLSVRMIRSLPRGHPIRWPTCGRSISPHGTHSHSPVIPRT